MLLSIIVLALALGVAVTVWLVRSITLPMSKVVKVAQTVAAGDLTSRIEVNSTDETGQLLQALKDMNDALLNIVREVRGDIGIIAPVSPQITSGKADLSSRTEEQASWRKPHSKWCKRSGRA